MRDFGQIPSVMMGVIMGIGLCGLIVYYFQIPKAEAIFITIPSAVIGGVVGLRAFYWSYPLDMVLLDIVW